jgi:hypothetical protein
MKTIRKHWLLPGKVTVKILLVAILTLLYLAVGTSRGQTPKTLAVLNIDTKNLELDPVAMGNLVRLELEKTKVYNVMDKYEAAYIIEKEGLNIIDCYGKTCLMEIAKTLKVDKLVAGYAERFGDKIVINLWLIDVGSSFVEKTNVTEYQYIPEEIQIMTEISVKRLLGLDIDPNLVNLLVNYEDPIVSTRTNLRLNGPRMGIAYITGDRADRLTAPTEDGGFDGYPYLSQFGYQYEIQYLSAGNFQALVEFLLVFSGLEQQFFNPNIVFMNGFRMGKGGWEIAFGPSVSLRKTAMGFYDENGLLSNNKEKWYLEEEWVKLKGTEITNPYIVKEQLDKRGDINFSTGWIWAIGKTFKSGYLNIPVNAYVSPDKEGWYVGFSIGFNVSRTRRRQDEK